MSPIHVEECRCLIVTAHFRGRCGVHLDSWWPALLDGLLAGVVRRLAPPRRPNDIQELPLTAWRRDTGKQWSWMASTAEPIDPHEGPGWQRRWDQEPTEVQLSCSGLRWRAVGDAAAVCALLRHVPTLGNRHASTPVMQWDVVDVGPGDNAWGAWMDSGRIARPFAARAAAALGVPGAETVDGAVRPPYWRPPPVTADGSFGRAWRPVLAPWTARPA